MKLSAILGATPDLITASYSSPDRTSIRPVAKEKAPTTMVVPAAQRSVDCTTGSGSIFFIGNATVLIRYAGFTILTDPTFIHKHGEVPLGYGLKTRRLTDPAVDIRDLPPLDLIVLSHFHGDHFDQVAERDLNKAIPIVTTQAAAKELARRGFTDIRPLETWGAVAIEKGEARLRITAMPGRHAPRLIHLALPDVMGSMLEFQSASESVTFRIYITGDTLVTDELKEIPRRYPNIDVGLLHLGGTRVLGLLVTMDGKQGVEAMRIVNPDRAIPIHYNDYDRFQSPLSDFQDEVKEAGLQDRIHYLKHGETYEFHVGPTMQGLNSGQVRDHEVSDPSFRRPLG
jgi:L-ascorbate metabolism protein UlaG (beta-lactamase superfamily)